MASPSAVYRPAEHGDCEGVMAIDRHLSGGLDYLQDKFHAYVTDARRFPFVVELNGEVVGYKCGFVIDDGLSIVSEAARVRADLRRKGLFTKLDQAVVQAARETFPNIRRTLWTSTNRQLTARTISKMHGRARLIATRLRVCFDCSGNRLQAVTSGASFRRLLARPGADVITAVPHRAAIDVLSDGVDMRTAVPEGVLVVNSQPWGLFRSTYMELLKGSTLHVNVAEDDDADELGKYSGTLGRDGASLGRSRGGEGITMRRQQIRCFSFHTVVGAAFGGMRCRVDFYCPPGARATQQAAAHLVYHVRELASCYRNEAVSFGFLFPQHVDKVTLKKLLVEELALQNMTTLESDGLVSSWDVDNPQAKL